MKNIQNKKWFKAIIFIVVLCIPLMYSFFYLKSYWDPYGNLTDMKIALVNLDCGKDGENQGANLVQKLEDTKKMDFVEMSESEAKESLENEEVYAVITVPSDFTECLKSAGEEQKNVATITYSPNQKSNYLASQIINKVVTSAEESVNSSVASEVVNSLSDSLKEVPDSLQEISDGADQIYEGTDSLNSGLQTLSDGLGLLSSKYTEFDDGVNSAYEGSKQLTDGVSQVNSGIDSLADGATTLDSAIDQISKGADSLNAQGTEGITKMVSSFSTLANGAKQVSDGVSSVATNLNSSLTAAEQAQLAKAGLTDASQIDASISSLKTAITYYGIDAVNPSTGNTFFDDYTSLCQLKGAVAAFEGAKQSITASANDTTSASSLYALSAGAKQLSDGAAQLTSTETVQSLQQLSDGISSLDSALTQVKSGTTSLYNGVSALKTGTTQVQNGSESLEQGLQTLSDSSSTVEDSLKQLSEGSESAVEGSQTLLDGVGTFKTEIDNGITDTKTELAKLDGLSEFTANPVEVVEEDYGKVDSYGIAFTPLFISIGLWVGALMLYVVLYYDQRHRFGIFDYAAKNKIAQNFAYIAVGAVMGLATGFILKLGLNYTVDNTAIYLLECSLVGAVFTTIIQFLIRNFGDLGKFIALIILVLQLAASGGTFPVETIFKGFRCFNGCLPMTYTIKIFKDCLISTETSFLGKNTLIVAGIAVVLVVITTVIEIIKKKTAKSEK